MGPLVTCFVFTGFIGFVFADALALYVLLVSTLFVLIVYFVPIVHIFLVADGRLLSFNSVRSGFIHSFICLWKACVQSYGILLRSWQLLDVLLVSLAFVLVIYGMPIVHIFHAAGTCSRLLDSVRSGFIHSFIRLRKACAQSYVLSFPFSQI